MNLRWDSSLSSVYSRSVGRSLSDWRFKSSRNSVVVPYNMGLPGSSFLPEDFQQRALEQALDDLTGVDASDFVHLGLGHRLPVGDDGEGLELRAR